MSTEIKTIKGATETEETRLILTRFYGGSENGTMLQLTVTNPEGYIQLSKRDVFNLAKTLINSFDRKIYPSE